ncbi:hypothetical protein GGX14DRAFT_406032 [Mycena pura]|uniref:Uncharacterized protein n=1 Tax=Mycena pura TaxID=153505 RepID=A0AAD6UQT2_9AGAR|nr:hypothetical protein GGX14DRAFT_406032 [Mycena pura]
MHVAAYRGSVDYFAGWPARPLFGHVGLTSEINSLQHQTTRYFSGSGLKLFVIKNSTCIRQHVAAALRNQHYVSHLGVACGNDVLDPAPMAETAVEESADQAQMPEFIYVPDKVHSGFSPRNRPAYTYSPDPLGCSSRLRMITVLCFLPPGYVGTIRVIVSAFHLTGLQAGHLWGPRAECVRIDWAAIVIYLSNSPDRVSIGVFKLPAALSEPTQSTIISDTSSMYDIHHQLRLRAAPHQVKTARTTTPARATVAIEIRSSTRTTETPATVSEAL